MGVVEDEEFIRLRDAERAHRNNAGHEDERKSLRTDSVTTYLITNREGDVTSGFVGDIAPTCVVAGVEGFDGRGEDGRGRWDASTRQWGIMGGRGRTERRTQECRPNWY